MGRTPIREIEQVRRKRAFSNLVLAGIAIVLLFAVVGVVSAGNFVAGQFSSSNKVTTQKPPPTHPAATPAGVRDIARAHAQATAIVKAAQTASQGIVSSATRRAHQRAAAIVSSAQRHAASIAAHSAAAATASVTQKVPSAANVAPTPVPTAVPFVAAAPTAVPFVAAVPTPTPIPVAATGPSSSNGSTASGQTAGSTTAGQAAGTGTTTSPDLSNVPASWRVVAYGATFGGGPGSAGSITVTNRGSKTYSGVATVVYKSGGSASASFSGLAPGETEVLPLEGPAYKGGGYNIVVNVG